MLCRHCIFHVPLTEGGRRSGRTELQRCLWRGTWAVLTLMCNRIKTVTKHYIRAVFRPAVCFQGGTSPVRDMVLLSSKLDSFGVKTPSAVNICIDLAILSLHVPLPRESACALRSGKQHKTLLTATGGEAPWHMANPAENEGGRLRKAPSADDCSQMTRNITHGLGFTSVLDPACQ